MNQSRKSRGQPTAGQFAAKANPESDTELSGVTTKTVRRWSPNGMVEYEAHYQSGQLQDLPDGTPAVREFHLDGTVEYEEHYQAGQPQDPADGSPAVHWLCPDGTVKYEEHWQDGRQVS